LTDIAPALPSTGPNGNNASTKLHTTSLPTIGV
jgi:hypothetical protein